MHDSVMDILCDIGGTFARFAVRGAHASGDRPERIRRIKACEFDSFSAALAHYCAEEGLAHSGTLCIATAAYEDGGVWRFVNDNIWVIDPVALENEGWNVELILNDFEAATWGLINVSPEDCHILKAAGSSAQNATHAKCLVGPGTGLGLGFLFNSGGVPFVQKTHGGHMPVSVLGAEEFEIVNHVRRQKTGNTTPVFEDFVSGQGLWNIYCAVCALNEQPTTAQGIEELFTCFVHNDQDAVNTALRLFHQFFGQFAANAVITGNAYGGLYLTGGVLERLIAADLFDFPVFEAGFLVGGVASVMQDLEATPVFAIKDPYPALKGLMRAKDTHHA